MRVTPVAVALLVAGLAGASAAHAQPPPAPAPGERPVITRADQLPRRSYTLAKLPSELLDAPAADLDAAASALDRDLAGDLATLDIRDRATKSAMLLARAHVAIHRGDYRHALEHLRAIRGLQEKEADRLLSGVLFENALNARLAGGEPQVQRAQVRASLAATWGTMPWDVVGDNLKASKASLELLSKNVALGSFRSSLDPAARNLGLAVPADILVAVLAARSQFDVVMPFRDVALLVLKDLVERHTAPKVDAWTPRLATLPADAKASPVVVGIWDSGTDLSLFQAAPHPGIAFDEDMRPAKDLVRPLGAAQARLPVLKGYVKGAMDLRAAIDSPEARAFRQRVATLKPGEVKGFREDMGAVSMWVHGTHVAGIAVAGNPFARVTEVAMHWSHAVEPQLPDEASAERTAQAFRAAVDSFRKAGARVVNMSWRYGPALHEGALAFHNVGRTPEERKARALALFAIERKALEEAIAGAPGILFVAGSGNEDNDADFSQYIPAGLELPNLLTAGAVDQAGTETAFSTFGRTVAVHANGFEVTSLMPGGEPVKLSGTSMAAPQVANLAAKLFAVRPDLTVAQAKALILAGAEKNGRVNLIHPKRTLQLAAEQAPARP